VSVSATWTIGILALAAGFGEMTAHPEEPVGMSMRRIMCAGLALHLLVMGISSTAGGASRAWTFG